MKQLLLATTLCLVCLAGQADEQKRLDRMASHLNLNDEQITQIQEIYASHKETRELLHEQKDALRREMREELGAVLTDEQLEKFNNMHRKRHKDKSYDQG